MESFDEHQRIIFHNGLDIMEVDFSELIFSNSSDVNTVYNVIETLIRKTQR